MQLCTDMLALCNAVTGFCVTNTRNLINFISCDSHQKEKEKRKEKYYVVYWWYSIYNFIRYIPGRAELPFVWVFWRTKFFKTVFWCLKKFSADWPLVVYILSQIPLRADPAYFWIWVLWDPVNIIGYWPNIIMLRLWGSWPNGRSTLGWLARNHCRKDCEPHK